MKKIFNLKTLLFSTLFFCFCQDTNAQIEKGNWMIGGSGNFFVAKSIFNLNLSPSAGYFFLPKTALGSAFSFGYSRMGSDFNGTYLGVSPFVRHYFLKPEKKINLFAEGSFTLRNQWYQTTNTQIDNYQFGFETNITAGLSYFILPNIGLEFKSTIRPPALSSFSQSDFSLFNTLGFQIFLPGKTK